MARNLSRLFTSPIVRSEISDAANRRSIRTTVQLLQNHQPEAKKSAPFSEVEEKIHKQIEDEEKLGSKDESESESDDETVNKQTGEVGGPRGPEPTRYGDWEKNGRCYDF